MPCSGWTGASPPRRFWQKGFLAGTEAAEENTGQFVFRDTGTSVADGAGTDRLVIGNDGTVTFGEAVKAKSFITASSARWKENVVPLENAAELVSRLHGVRYRWKGEAQETGAAESSRAAGSNIPAEGSGMPSTIGVGADKPGTAGWEPGTGTGREDLGFIAEEVAAVVPEAVAGEDMKPLPVTGKEPPAGSETEFISTAAPVPVDHAPGCFSFAGTPEPVPDNLPGMPDILPWIMTDPGGASCSEPAPLPGRPAGGYSSRVTDGVPGRQAASSPPPAGGVMYGKLLAVALECLKEQQARLDGIARRRDAIRQRLAELAVDKR